MKIFVVIIVVVFVLLLLFPLFLLCVDSLFLKGSAIGHVKMLVVAAGLMLSGAMAFPMSSFPNVRNETEEREGKGGAHTHTHTLSLSHTHTHTHTHTTYIHTLSLHHFAFHPSFSFFVFFPSLSLCPFFVPPSSLLLLCAPFPSQAPCLQVNSLLLEDDYQKPYLHVIDFVKYGAPFSFIVVVVLLSVGYLLFLVTFG